MNKIVNDKYILGLTENNIGEPIINEEYLLIKEAMDNCPALKTNQYAMLKKNLEWEIFTSQIEESESEMDNSLLDILTGEI